MSWKRPEFPDLPEVVEVTMLPPYQAVTTLMHREEVYEAWVLRDLMANMPGWRELAKRTGFA